MPHFVYDGDDERSFPDAGLTVKPGDVVECDENPSERYFQPVEPVLVTNPEVHPDPVPEATEEA